MARRKTPPLSELRLDLLVILSLALIGGAYYLHVSPLLMTTSDPEVTGTLPPPTQPAADTLLLLPDRLEGADPADNFQSLDMSYGWFNTLTQEQGAVRHAQIARFVPGLLGDVRLLVVSRGAARELAMSRVEAISQWVHEGGVLLLEQPDPRWSELTRLPLEQGTLRPTRRVTAADGAPLRGALRDAMLDAPLPTTMLQLDLAAPSADPSNPMRIVLEVDGRPALIYTPAGKGHVYTLTIDLARAITTLQQGRPLDDFTLPIAEDDPDLPPGMTRPHQLLASTRMQGTYVPYADLLERNVMETVSMHVPIPRFWYFPDTWAGVFVMSHDEDRFGDRARFVLDWEQENEAASTLFFTADSLSSDLLNDAVAKGHDPQLQWNRGLGGELLTARAGLSLWRPVQQEMSLLSQKNVATSQLQERPITLTRAQGQVIDARWSGTFEKLAAARVVADSTYGPTSPKHHGYLFGTSLPFYPLDAAGLLLPVAELPFVLRDDTEELGTRQRRLLALSESGHHQVIIANYRVGAMTHSPSVEAFNAWRAAFRRAARHNHWVTTLRAYLLFEEARRTSSLSSRFFPENRRLEIEAQIAEPRIEALGDDDKPPLPSIAVPQNWDGSSVESVRLNGRPVRLKKLGRSGDGFYHILQVDKAGKHIVHITYAGRVDPDDLPR